MSLKAGRVGVSPDQVDEFGKINSSATEGYTKQEADGKFETKEAAAALQPKTLALPISMLVGSQLVPITTVEDVIQTMNNAMTNGELTEKVKVKEGTVTSDFTIANYSKLYKVGNIVIASLFLSGVTKDAFTDSLFNIPQGFRPKASYIPVAMNIGNDAIGKCTIFGSNGNAQSSVSLSNKEIFICATWVTD